MQRKLRYNKSNKYKENGMKITHYWFKTDKTEKDLRIAVVADLHSRAPDAVISAVEQIRPDAVCIAGDLTEALDGTLDGKNENGFRALRALSAIAPVFYAPGNHEIGASHNRMRKKPYPQRGGQHISPENLCRIKESGACFLENTFTEWQGIAIGGLGSGMLELDGKPRIDALEAFFAHQGYKILICHHPEYYTRYLRELDVDMVISGHAHGGQWRVFGQGIYSPDQGVFPKYTSGVHEGRLVISKGTANSVGMIPRFFNPCEVLCIHINQEENKL